MSTPPISSGVTMNTLKSRILNPALTSIYSVIIEPPPVPDKGIPLTKYFNDEFGLSYDKELMELTCLEASLPGSSLATIETMDYTGVTEKHAYRRLYDDTIDFTFLVTQNSNYHQIRFFDAWLRFITNEQKGKNINQPNFYSRVRYPKEYQTTMSVTKFEKNLGSGFTGAVPLLIYNFAGAYPKAINSVPVSYDQSDLLKVTVSFTYTRYYIDTTILSGTSNSSSRNPNAPAVPLPTTTAPNQSNTRASWRYSQQELDRIRGAAAVASLARSPLGVRALEGTSRSSVANEIGRQSLERILGQTLNN